MSIFADTIIRARTLRGLVPVFRTMWRGYKHRQLEFKSDSQSAALSFPTQMNPLFKYFSEHRQGRGIYKFDHYFERYEQHFSKFRGKEVHVLEIGIFSGGSLEMWRNYFGPSCKVYGVDIDPRCKAYESDSVRVLTGDQSDKSFWMRFRQEVPAVDIVIDDGGHTAEQQIVSLEELLPHLRPGGVYVCEDVHEPFSEFAAYVCGLAQDLNSAELEYNFQDNERYSVSRTNSLQSAIAGIHFYPFMAVIERTAAPVFELIAPKRGSQWLP